MSTLQHVAPSANGAGHAPATQCPPDCPSCNGERYWENPCATRIARHDARKGSAANLQAHLLYRTLEMVCLLADGYLDWHPEGCDCIGCSSTPARTVDTLRQDIRGISWVAAACASYLGGAAIGCKDDLAGTSLEDGFRDLMEEAAALDALERAEGLTLDDADQDADEPVAVSKPR